jgi:hypothetical protein
MIGGIIALVGTWIAARQMVIANEKLQLDAFDRQYEKRFAVYVDTRKILGDVYLGNISDAEIRVYGLCTLDAKFLFDDKLYRYLSEIRQRVAAWNHAKLMVQSESGDEKDEYKRIAEENLKWIQLQGDDNVGFDVKFTPFLVHKHVKRSWLLRWPCEE